MDTARREYLNLMNAKREYLNLRARKFRMSQAQMTWAVSSCIMNPDCHINYMTKNVETDKQLLRNLFNSIKDCGLNITLEFADNIATFSNGNTIHFMSSFNL